MAKIEVHAGDFRGNGMFMSVLGSGAFTLMSEAHPAGEGIPLTEVATVEMASEESVKKLGGTVGWGLAGAALLGPVGLLAGLLKGGNKKQVTFVCVFKDGRKMLATTDSKTYTKIMAAAF